MHKKIIALFLSLSLFSSIHAGNKHFFALLTHPLSISVISITSLIIYKHLRFSQANFRFKFIIFRNSLTGKINALVTKYIQNGCEFITYELQGGLLQRVGSKNRIYPHKQSIIQDETWCNSMKEVYSTLKKYHINDHD